MPIKIIPTETTRAIKQGDAVTIRLLNKNGGLEEFHGQVTQEMQTEDGRKRYFVACPFMIDEAHIRVIVPVEDLEH